VELKRSGRYFTPGEHSAMAAMAIKMSAERGTIKVIAKTCGCSIHTLRKIAPSIFKHHEVQRRKAPNDLEVFQADLEKETDPIVRQVLCRLIQTEKERL